MRGGCGDGVQYPPVGDPDVPCCMGSALDGPSGCTCWRPRHDLEQQAVDSAAEVTARALMCAGCAYRPGSPEKRGEDGYAGNPTELERTALGARFFCHEGMRRIVAHVHPEGVEVPGHPAAYDPPMGHDADARPVAYRADGQPAQLCAGWAARRKALLASARPVQTDAELAEAQR